MCVCVCAYVYVCARACVRVCVCGAGILTVLSNRMVDVVLLMVIAWIINFGS